MNERDIKVNNILSLIEIPLRDNERNKAKTIIKQLVDREYDRGFLDGKNAMRGKHV